MKLPAIIFAPALTGVAMPSVFAQTSDATVAVEGGKIQGVAADVAGITVYKAIPFAAPPGTKPLEGAAASGGVVRRKG